MTNNRSPKNRPSNILIYVVVSLVGLVVLFLVGSFLESRVFGTGDDNSLSSPRLLSAQVTDGH